MTSQCEEGQMIQNLLLWYIKRPKEVYQYINLQIFPERPTLSPYWIKTKS